MIARVPAAVRRFACAGLFALAGCALPTVGHEVWVTAGPRELSTLPHWSGSDAAGLLAAMRLQCAGRWRDGAADPREAGYRRALCAVAGRPDPGAAPVSGGGAPDRRLLASIERAFVAWPVVEDRGRGVGLLTGYHEPAVSGSRTRRHEGQAPLYRLPPATGATTPGPSRAEIERDPAAAGLAGRELVWIDDPVEAFFLQIQGSGRVALDDGGVMRVGFAGHNGHSYHAIGRTLIERGALTRAQLSADAIKRWLREHPAQAGEVMRANPRVIFFRELPPAPAGQGPTGALGLPLTPLRSVAVDLTRLPAGALLFAQADIAPDADAGRHSGRGHGAGARKTVPGPGLVLAQDTGAAIRGPVRADWFTGSDEHAARLASGLDERLRLWMLWPRGKRPPGRLPLAWPEPVY